MDVDIFIDLSIVLSFLSLPNSPFAFTKAWPSLLSRLSIRLGFQLLKIDACTKCQPQHSNTDIKGHSKPRSCAKVNLQIAHTIMNPPKHFLRICPHLSVTFHSELTGVPKCPSVKCQKNVKPGQYSRMTVDQNSKHHRH